MALLLAKALCAWCLHWLVWQWLVRQWLVVVGFGEAILCRGWSQSQSHWVAPITMALGGPNYNGTAGINIFLAGFVPTENMRFRDEALSFKVVEVIEEEKASEKRATR
jgi:hypothetical protein